MPEEGQGDSALTSPTRAWRSSDPWLRFVLLALVALVVAAFIPPWTSPSTIPPTTVATSTTLSSASFDFTADAFLDRWNRVGIDEVLAVEGYGQPGSTENLFYISVPEHEVEWAVRVSVDPSNGRVRQVELIASVSSSGSNELGMLMVIAAVEEVAPEDAQVKIIELLDLADEAAGSGDPIDVAVRGEKARYRLALSAEVQFLFQATP